KIFTSALLNTARLAFNRTFNEDDFFPFNIGNIPRSLMFNPNYSAPEGGDFGNIGIGGATAWGPSTTNGKSNVLNRTELTDSVVWTRGHHSLKFGGTWDHFQFNVNTTARYRGAYAFANLSSFLRGIAQTFQVIGAPVTRLGLRSNIIGFFAQDDYRMLPNL